jgi:uncharacterized protein YndB with AHSA1/START domain
VTCRLTVDRVVPAAPPRAWATFTTEPRLAGWWWAHLPGTTYRVDARVGGETERITAALGRSSRGHDGHDRARGRLGDGEPAKAYEQGWRDLLDALERGA